MVSSVASLRVGAGISTRRTGRSAIEEALHAALAPLEGSAPDLVFLFVAPQFEDELAAIVSYANDRVASGVVLGCVAGGVIGAGHEVEDAPAVSAWAARLPGVAVRTFRTTFTQDGEHGYFHGFDELPSRDRGSVMVMVADPSGSPPRALDQAACAF